MGVLTILSFTVLCYTFYGSTALEFQSKLRVEPVKTGFMKESGEYFDDIKGKGKRCVGRFTDCLEIE